MNNDNDLMLDVGQADKLKFAFRRAGYSNGEIDKLCEGTILRDFRNVLLGRAEVKMIENVIDLDADPFVPDGWIVKEHKRGGLFKWNSDQILFYLSDKQKNGRSMNGNRLRKELEDKPVFNANLIDYLLANQHLIPDEWKKDEEGRTRFIFAWGTIYRPSRSSLYVRCMYWNGDKWDWECDWLFRWIIRGWGVDRPAALRAS